MSFSVLSSLCLRRLCHGRRGGRVRTLLPRRGARRPAALRRTAPGGGAEASAGRPAEAQAIEIESLKFNSKQLKTIKIQ